MQYVIRRLATLVCTKRLSQAIKINCLTWCNAKDTLEFSMCFLASHIRINRQCERFKFFLTRQCFAQTPWDECKLKWFIM
jgi:hypothetical protein